MDYGRDDSIQEVMSYHEHYCPVCTCIDSCNDPECPEDYQTECIHCLHDGERDLSA